MATNLTESKKAGHGVASEANGTRAREEEILVSGQDLVPGAVVGKITASGKITEYNPANGDGSEAVYGILYSRGDATGGDLKVTAVVRDAEYDEDSLAWFSGATGPQIDTGKDELEALGIIARATGVTATLADQA